MLDVIKARLFQGHRTMKFPAGSPPALPPRFRGRPVQDAAKCEAGCDACRKSCPTGAIGPAEADGARGLDLGKCLFCADCVRACPRNAIAHDADHRLAFAKREDMVVRFDQKEIPLFRWEGKKAPHIFRKSLKLREVSAGGCNACEADVNVLSTIGWDLGRFGISVVASPRHADGLLVTGPVTRNMALALRKTYDAVPEPKVVIAVGSCPASGGPFAGLGEAAGFGDIPVDLWIPGCPPHPLTILDGLLRFMGRNDKALR